MGSGTDVNIEVFLKGLITGNPSSICEQLFIYVDLCIVT